MIQKIVCGILLLSTGSLTAQADPDSVAYNRQDSLYALSLQVSNTGGYEAESGIEQQDLSSFLQASPDVFTQMASLQFGIARYRARGYSAASQQVMINSVSMNGMENGFTAWNSWGGLNDVTRYPEAQQGNSASRYGFSGPGGYIQMDTRASSFAPGTRLSYASANRVFQNRVMLTHATGLLRNNWALAASISSRQGSEIYLPGTFLRAVSFFLSADKRINSKHLLSASGFFTPIEQGRAGAVQLEATRLAGTNYYNPLWGYQQGRVRHSAVHTTRQPLLMLTHLYQPRKNATLSSSVFYTFGRTGLTGLNWNNSPNPKPDYYYYLPSYYYQQGNVQNGDHITQQWLSDVNTRQINWDQLIAMNQGNLYTLPQQMGLGINTSETRARYILEERIEQKNHLGFSSVYNKQSGRLFLSLGANAALYKNRKYKQVNDLLGASYWLDYDQFAQNLGLDPMIQQNNIDEPDKKIYRGDKFGYDYTMHVSRAELWAQAEYSFKRLDVYAGLSGSGSQVWKESYMANGKFKTSSKGPSAKTAFFNYGFKTGAAYKLSGRQVIKINGLLMTRAPEAGRLFVSQTVRNDLVSGITSEKILSGDANYLLSYPTMKLRLTYYYTQISGQSWLRSYWNDAYATTINYFMTGVNENHQGLELGIEKTLFASHVLQCALGYGRHVYTSRPLAQAWQDNNSLQLFTGRSVYIKNFRTGSSPQLAAGIGYKYTARRYWFAGINLNYFDGIYVEPSPDRRTAESVAKYVADEMDQVNAIIRQQKLPGYYLLNLSAGKSFLMARKYHLRIHASVNNLLNKRSLVAGGYEQLRWDDQHTERFASKYTFMTGTTYLAMASFNF